MAQNRTLWAMALATALLLSTPALAQSPGINAYSTTPVPPPTAYYSPPVFPLHRLLTRNDLAPVRAQIALGNFRQARSLLRRHSPSSSSEARYLAGVVDANLGDYAAADRAFAASLAADRQHVGARVGAALLDIRFGRYADARDALDAIEARRAGCRNICRDAAALDRGAEVLRHFLPEPPAA